MKKYLYEVGELINEIENTSFFNLSVQNKDNAAVQLIDGDTFFYTLLYNFSSRQFVSVMPTLSQGVEQFKHCFNLFKVKNNYNFSKMYQALYDYEYNPIENYNRFEDSERNVDTDNTYNSNMKKTGTEALQHGETLTKTGTEALQHGETLKKTGTEEIEVTDRFTKTGTEALQHGETLTKTGTEELEKSETDHKTGTESLQHGESISKTGTEALQHGESLLHSGTETDTYEEGKTKTGTHDLEYGSVRDAESGTNTHTTTGSKTTENYKSGMNSYDTYTKDNKSVETFDNYQESDTFGKSSTKTGNELETYNLADSEESDRTKTYNLTDTKSGTDTTTFNTTDAKSGIDTTTYNTTDTKEETDTTTFNTTEAKSGTDTTTFNTSDAKSGTDTTTFNTTDAKGGTDSTDTVETFTSNIHGNIGVTTNQQMIEAELALRVKSLQDIIIEQFVNDYTIYC